MTARCLVALLPALLLIALAGCGPECVEGPPIVPGDGGVSWGEAASGLRISVVAPQTTYVEGEDMRFTVRVENVSGGPLKLSAFEDEMWWYRLFFENQGEGPDFQAANEELIDYDAPPDLTLGAGEVWTKELRLTEWGRFLRVIPNRQPGDDWDYRKQLPPGPWRAWLTFDGGLRGRAGFWSGPARSNVLEITIEAAP